jgi:anti-anti-sigma factor
MSLSIVESGEKATIVALHGRLDAAGVQAVQTEFLQSTAALKKPAIVDMSDVTFMASLGIRMLVEAAKSLKSSGARLVLIKPQPLVEKSLKSSGLDVVVGIFHDESQARQAVGA